MTLPLDPEPLIKLLSAGKAAAVSEKHSKAVVVAADTFVVFGNKKLGKPKSTAEAARMLRMISGKKVEILTCVTVQRGQPKKKMQKLVKTFVHFRRMEASEIKKYIATGEPMDKAGAFAVQGLGAAFIDRLEGEYTGAMGLPLHALIKLLRTFGINAL
jgi:septum formation protein